RSADDLATGVGLFGFGVRGGIELSWGSQLILGTTLDAGNLFTARLRLRPSGEIGLFRGPNTYTGSLEAVYRFTGDEQFATPYAGGGFSVAGHDRERKRNRLNSRHGSTSEAVV